MSFGTEKKGSNERFNLLNIARMICNAVTILVNTTKGRKLANSSSMNTCKGAQPVYDKWGVISCKML